MNRSRILALYAGGLPVPEIARRVGCSTSTVYAVTRGAGLTRTQQLHADVLAALQGADKGMSSGEIAVAIGRPDMHRGRISNSVLVLRGRGHVIESHAGGKGGYRILKETKS